MTPKEKAKELFNNMYDKIEDTTAGMFEEDIPYLDIRYRAAKECAIIAVDEILNAIDWHEFEAPNKQLEYWQEVKHELQNL